LEESEWDAGSPRMSTDHRPTRRKSTTKRSETCVGTLGPFLTTAHNPQQGEGEWGGSTHPLGGRMISPVYPTRRADQMKPYAMGSKLRIDAFNFA